MDKRREYSIWSPIQVIILLGLSLLVTAQNKEFTISPSNVEVGLQSVDMSCRFDIGLLGASSLVNIKWYRGSTEIAHIFYGNPTHTVEIIDGDLNARATLTGPVLPTSKPGANYIVSGNLRIDTVVCSDAQSYYCEMTVGMGLGSDAIERSDATLDLVTQVRPGQPTVTYASGDVAENTNVEFTCVGNVGKPAGAMSFAVVKQGVELFPAVVDESPGDSPTLNTTDLCTYDNTKRITYTLTKEHDGAYVQCTTVQDLGTATDDIDTPLSVLFSITEARVSVSNLVGDQASNAEDETITFVCEAEGNPLPTYTWFFNSTKEGSDTVERSGQRWQKRLTKDDAGKYQCEAQNNVSGTVVARESSVIHLTVTDKPTTTEAPSTTPDETTGTNQGEPSTQAATADEGLGTGAIAGIVVGLCLLIIIVIVVIVFMMKRKSKKGDVEEPSHKPHNNHDMAPVSSKPDLVTNGADRYSPDKKYNSGHNPAYEKNPDSLTYTELAFDQKPRSRKPIAISDDPTVYADVQTSYPRV